MDIGLHIGKKIYSRRRAKNMTQSELGGAIGVTFQQIQKYEKGLNKISASKLFDISIALNTTINFFFDGVISSKEGENLEIREDSLEFKYDNAEDMLSSSSQDSLKWKQTKTKLLKFLENLTED